MIGTSPDMGTSRLSLVETMISRQAWEGTGRGRSITYDIIKRAHGGGIAVDTEIGAFTVRGDFRRARAEIRKVSRSPQVAPAR